MLRFDTRTNALAGRIAVGGADIGAVAYDDGADRLVPRPPRPRRARTRADGVVTVHDRSGAEVARYPAGVIPGAIAFRTE